MVEGFSFFPQSTLKDTLMVKAGDTFEASYQRYTTIFVVTNLPLTAG